MARSRINWSRFDDSIKSDSWRSEYSRPMAGVTSNDGNLSKEPVDKRGVLYALDILVDWEPFTDAKGAFCNSGVVAVGAIVKRLIEYLRIEVEAMN